MITHRSIEEGIAMEKGKNTEEYFRACSVIEMNELDMLRMEIEEKTTVRVVSDCGEVIVTATIGKQELMPGMCHIRQGVWANQIVPTGTQSTGVPQFSGFKVTVTPAPGAQVKKARDLIFESLGLWRGDVKST